MPAATNKADLLAVTKKDFAKLQKLLAELSDDVTSFSHDGTTIKDVIGHRAHWIDLFLGWYADGQAGRPVHIPAKGYKWNELKRYNAELRQRQAGLSWTDVQDMLNANHQKLLKLINNLDDATLYGGPMKGGNNAWTTGRFAEASGPSHYRSAAKYIRSAIRAAT